ncbi:MAG: MBL fold metallo-hydrolase [Micromonosporaceae bacterium]
MLLTVLGGAGAWPSAEQPCSGYVVEHDGFRLLLDPGYATAPALMRLMDVADIDAVYVTHGHPDHCADLNPLLRARAMADSPPRPLPLYALPGSLDAVLGLDRPGMLEPAYQLREFEAGDHFEIGPFAVDTRMLPHSRPNAGVRLTTGGSVLAYTGDTGPSRDVVALARRADLLIAEATYPVEVPADNLGTLTSARDAALQAADAEVGHLMLTHLWPGTNPDAAIRAAEAFSGPTGVATTGLTVHV